MAGEQKDKNKKGESVLETQSPMWWRVLNDARTYFEQGSAL
jgi:hypothetical protein